MVRDVNHSEPATLRVLTPRLHRPPVPPTPLIDREAETAALRARLLQPDARLVTVTGPPGTGKTRLALEVAGSLRADFMNGAAFVDLARISDPMLVPAAIAEALGVREGEGEPLRGRLHGYLADKQLLLLLDNFEHVLDAAVEVADLLAACPRLTVLVTSRAALRLRGEQLFPVPPLALPPRARTTDLAGVARSPAVSLFVQRAQAVQPQFRLAPDNAQAVADVCIHLDGLPLSIELAAARSSVLPPRLLLGRLSRRLALLRRGARDLADRHQTLDAAIGWSYELLTPEEQQLFRHLGVFAGGATLEAVEAVIDAAGHGDDVFEGLTGLAEQNLLYQEEQSDGEPRFRMLETLREYAVEQLTASGESEAAHRRHAAWFLALAERADAGLKGADHAMWREHLERDHDNLRAAMRWAIDSGDAEIALRLTGALAWFWARSGHQGEGLRWSEAALAITGTSVHPRFRARALFGAGVLAWVHGDALRSDRLQQESVAIARAIEDQQVLGYALAGLALVANFRGEPTAAAATAAESARCFRKVGDSWGLGFAYDHLGISALTTGDLVAARSWLEQNMDIAQALGDAWAIGSVLLVLAQVDIVEGEYRLARERLTQSLAISEELRDSWRVAQIISALGSAAFFEQDIIAARAHYEQGLVLSRELGYRPELAWCIVGLAAVALGEGQFERAARLSGVADVLVRDAGRGPPRPERAVFDQVLSAARAQMDEPAIAAAWAEGQTMTLAQAAEYALSSAVRAGDGVPTPTEPEPDDRAAVLTRREREVAALVARGLTNRQIASELVIAEGTAANHVEHIREKLGVRSRTQIAAWAVEHDLRRPSSP